MIGRALLTFLVLPLQVREARELPAADSNGLSDPFFWVFFNNQHRKESAVVYKTLSPKWEQSFEL